MNSIYLRKHAERRLQAGHAWIFSNEIGEIRGTPERGEIVVVRKVDGHFLGRGFYNPHSLIAVRLLTRADEPVDAGFFRVRLERALALRELCYPAADALRLVHSESDGLPGLVVDRYADALCLQVNSAGMEGVLDIVVDQLKELLQPRIVVLRNESQLRTLEGLPLYKKVVHGPEQAPLVEIHEHGLTYAIDVLEGQKTGFFLDQRENRGLLRRFVRPGARVLDAFCNEGGFALNAAAAGAASVRAIDVSTAVLERARHNAHVNGFDGVVRFEQGDLTVALPKMAETQRFDLINLDPPNFARSRKAVAPARRAYRNLHEAALTMLERGGVLATSCCSHHITEETFFATVTDAALRRGKLLMLLQRSGHPPDHPSLPSMPETAYLKFFVFAIA